MRSASDAPACLLCGGPTTLLYPSNVPVGEAIAKDEMACTSPHLSIHDDIFTCRTCGLARSQPAHSIEEIEDLYRDVEDHDYLASEEERRADFRRALEAIEAHPFVDGPGTVLEIGSAVGLFLDEAQKRGWTAVGIEPSRWATHEAQQKGLSVFNGTLEEFDADGKRFDVIASWDVWEHLEDPVRALELAHRLLKPGGLLVVTTVNMGGVMAKLMRGKWPWFMRMHLHYFTRGSLREMVKRAGFDVLRLSTQSKTLKLGYLMARSRKLFGPIGAGADAIVGRLGLRERPVRIDTGDILLVEARRA